MAYCTITDVQTVNAKRTYSATTTPTTTQVNSLIDFIAADIDGILAAKRYTTPVTEPTAFVNWLKWLNALGAAAEAEAAMYPEAVEKGSTPHEANLRQKYEDRLEMLVDGKITPQSIRGEDVSSFYHVMEDQDDFPDPAFRKRSEDLEF
jgi:hypothetical protein